MTDEGCSCGDVHVMTVRDLIRLLMEVAPSLEATVAVSSNEGELTLAYSCFGVADVSPDDVTDPDDMMVSIVVGAPIAWETATGKDVQGVVLVGDLDVTE